MYISLYINFTSKFKKKKRRDKDLLAIVWRINRLEGGEQPANYAVIQARDGSDMACHCSCEDGDRFVIRAFSRTSLRMTVLINLLSLLTVCTTGPIILIP